MKKPLSIQINIPKPCSEDWDQMTHCQQGRFCEHCQKQVIDFTKWTDTELYKFLSKNEAPVCGRFSSYQINRPIHLPYQPHSRLYRMAAGLGLVLLFTQVPEANARIRPPFAMEQIIDNPKDKNDSTGTCTIKGVILDDKKQPIIGAVIEMMQENKRISAVATDIDGNFTINNLPQGKYDIKVSYLGYETKLIKDTTLSSDKTTEIIISLKEDLTRPPTIILGGPMYPLIEKLEPTKNNKKQK